MWEPNGAPAYSPLRGGKAALKRWPSQAELWKMARLRREGLLTQREGSVHGQAMKGQVCVLDYSESMAGVMKSHSGCSCS